MQAMYDKIVILTGAGISAESGLGTFRDAQGLWAQHRIEDVATPAGFARNPDLVQAFTMPAGPRLLWLNPTPPIWLWLSSSLAFPARSSW